MRHGEVTLFETIAICTYIDRAFPGPGLIPAGAEGAALVEQWVSFVTTSFDPVCMRQYVLSYVFPNTPDKSPDRAAIDAALPKMEKLLAMLDAALAKTAYIAGPAFTLADAFAAPIVSYLTKFPESSAMLAKNAHLHAWFKRVIERPSVASTAPPPPPPK